jgi:hypothetical protein
VDYDVGGDVVGGDVVGGDVVSGLHASRTMQMDIVLLTRCFLLMVLQRDRKGLQVVKWLFERVACLEMASKLCEQPAWGCTKAR